MASTLNERAAVFNALLSAWNGADPELVRELITADYRGHMLHLPQGERTGADYSNWIQEYRAANPGATFGVVEQSCSGDRLWSRLKAHLPNGEVAHGFNISRFEGGHIAEEWALWSTWLPDTATAAGS